MDWRQSFADKFNEAHRQWRLGERENISVSEMLSSLTAEERIAAAKWLLDGTEHKVVGPYAQMRYVQAGGVETFKSMQEFVRSTPLYDHGDARLYWVNEGDVMMLHINGLAQNMEIRK
jgi:hypothetical protein